MEKDNRPPTRTGMILGKFMPPHLGHQYLVDFARHYVDRLSVLVCSLACEPIPGHLRFNWMRQMFPDADVIHLTDENPQEPQDHPDFWQIWHDSIRRVLPIGPDLVFASEDYGWTLAKILGAQYIPVDRDRTLVPISGTAIRTDPLGNWNYLPPCVRPYFLCRICIIGPESTGKSTLARQLADRYRTVYVNEYARSLLDYKQGRCDYEDIDRIARGQIASEEALAPQSNRILFCDTDLITTTIWSEVLFDRCPNWIRAEADRRTYDLYLVTDCDVPWVEDCQRNHPHQREWFRDRCIRELEQRDRSFVLLSGTWEQRFLGACQAVNRFFAL
ncbi:MAG: AAA family ATPase [Synechococcus sp.]